MPFRIAISGINAASTGLRTTANNIANVGSDGFRASRVEFAELSTTGDQAVGRGVRTARIAQPSAEPVNGNASRDSNVELAKQLLNMIKFATQFKAQAKVLRTASENVETVSDMLGNRNKIG